MHWREFSSLERIWIDRDLEEDEVRLRCFSWISMKVRSRSVERANVSSFWITEMERNSQSADISRNICVLWWWRPSHSCFMVTQTHTLKLISHAWINRSCLPITVQSLTRSNCFLPSMGIIRCHSNVPMLFAVEFASSHGKFQRTSCCQGLRPSLPH